MYKVLTHFTDLQDNYYPYNTGEYFPRKGKVVDQQRIDELSSNKNKRGIKLIEKIEEILEGTEKKETKRKKTKE